MRVHLTISPPTMQSQAVPEEDSTHDAGDGTSSEAARLRVLDRYRILDTPREQDFDDITALAGEICGTPIAVTTLLAAERQWFKAEVGLGISETPLNVSFCRHAVLGVESMVVPDATLDPRFRDNPLVTGEPHLRFYAGAILRSADGVPFGTLCVLDYEPRQPTAAQIRALEVLARQVVTQLELRRALREQHERDARHRQIVASAIDYAIITMDPEGRVTSWSEGARRVLGWTEEEMLGATAHRFFTPEDRAARRPDTEMELSREHGFAPDERWHLRKDGSRIWTGGEMMPLRDEAGRFAGYLKIVRDRTEMRRIAEERSRAERALVASELRWRTLFERMQEGFFVAEAVRDAGGAIGDLRFVEVNPAFATLTGITSDMALGRTFLEVVPELPKDLIATYARVIETGEAVEFDTTVPSLRSRWYEVRVRKTDGDQVAVMFVDVTQRRLADGRRAGLVELGDRLRNLRSTADMARAAGEILARTLGVDRAGYGTVDPLRDTVTIEGDWTAPGVDSIVGVLRFRDYGSYIEDLKRGETVVFSDATKDPRTAASAGALIAIGARSTVNMPMNEHGALVGLFFANHAEARDWGEEEVTFIRNVADRTRAAIGRARAEERQRLLNRELGHRLKNTLAMVQAIAAQTLRNASSVGEAQEALGARMVALGKAHDLLLSGEREAADLRELIARSVQILGDGRAGVFRLAGPDMEVGSRAALSLALMLHELGTNAVKYGALSVAEGHVEIAWSSSDDRASDGTFRLIWSEHGGPPVAAPDRKGFGSRLITRGLAGQIGGEVALTYPAEGVRCELVCSLLAFQADEIHPVRTKAFEAN